MANTKLSNCGLGLFVSSYICSALFLYCSGLVSAENRSIVEPIIRAVFFILWLGLYTSFGTIFFKRCVDSNPTNFFILCLYYAICSVIPLIFFNSRSDLPILVWLPTSLNTGVLVGLGLRDCFLWLHKKFFGPPPPGDGDGGLLPYYNPRTISPYHAGYDGFGGLGHGAIASWHTNSRASRPPPVRIPRASPPPPIFTVGSNSSNNPGDRAPPTGFRAEPSTADADARARE
ncbi:hypothetical protein P154DRAFT_575172 [Amniculicola lignicola CBS 123094]|uniref:Uncharacterized protein n=1 Tax=Amniculicola lignicola CBS 123094 TaxID=1392246 RepID=A0A6A5WIE5_9PLEO|nr:hypothetical protein P154DRAFT_575172 [Amniculicola lignicola CBS 123094]